ncbi:MFS transporter [Anaeroselena agilis]|uniref:MFS transporter n=1 Tax=Anaeroselena agilis TaxID=3063788 RepID=A0ABU3P219_9FIRM|nr:MFS transporter [Selenomonadales bacterium 4137-cl]
MGNNEQKFYGWYMVAVLWVIYLINLGFPLYGGAVINSFMIKDIPMDRMTYGAGFSLTNLFVGLGAIPAGMAVLKYGIRKTFAMGAVVLVIGTVWLSQVATQPWHYLIGFGVLNGFGMAMGTMLPLATTVTRWFVRYRGRAMAIAMTASGFAGFIASPAINKFIAATGGNWRLAWLCVTGACVIAGIIAFMFIKERPQDYGQIPDGREATEAEKAAAAANPLYTKYAWTPAEAYKTAAYWFTVLAAACSQWPFFFFTAHWIMHLRGKGVNPADAAFAMGIFTMGGIAGRLISGWLMDRIPARFVMMLGLCCYFVGSFLAIKASPSTLMLVYIAAACYGAGFGWCFVAQQTMLGHFFGPAAFPKLNGNLLAISAVLVSGAGLVGGRLFDVFKGYNEAFYLNVAMGVLGIVLLIFTTMPKAPSASESAPSVKA